LTVQPFAFCRLLAEQNELVDVAMRENRRKCEARAWILTTTALASVIEIKKGAAK
jgi:hypothetical protein